MDMLKKSSVKFKPTSSGSIGVKPDGNFHGVANQGAAFQSLVSAIAKNYGVKVAADIAPAKNPYAMTPDEAAKVARRAGIITKAGKLSALFK
jgi:hypothetical protein